MNIERFKKEEFNSAQHDFVIYFVIQNFYLKNNIELSREQCLMSFSKHSEGNPDIANQKLLASIFHQYADLLFNKNRRYELINSFENNLVPSLIIYKNIPEDIFHFIIEINANQYLLEEEFHDYGEGYHFIISHPSPLVYQSFLVYLINELQLLLFNKDYSDFIFDIYTTKYKQSIG